GIGRVGQNLLVAGHRGVEAHFSHRMAGRTEARPLEHGSVRQHKQCSRLGLKPGLLRRGLLCRAHQGPKSPARAVWFGPIRARLEYGFGAGLRKAIAVLRDEINTALKEAMKARDERRVSTLRLVNAAIKNADIEAETSKKAALSDDDLLGLLQKMI